MIDGKQFEELKLNEMEKAWIEQIDLLAAEAHRVGFWWGIMVASLIWASGVIMGVAIWT